MEAVALIARLDGITADDLIVRVHDALVEPIFPRTASAVTLPISLLRRSVATWAFLYLGALALYFTCSSLDLLVLYLIRLAKPAQQPSPTQKSTGFTDSTTTPASHGLIPPDTNILAEIRLSVSSLLLMTLLSVPLELGIQLGFSKVYHSATDYPLPYLLISPVLFVLTSDFFIYLIHRALHHPSLYRHIHKPHHSFIHTTPFAAFAFHPLDGFLQGVAYQLFPYVLPFHTLTHLVSMGCVLLWTINIHDRASLAIPGVNGAAHHTVHHTTFKSNYGQYFTLWDRAFGTFRDPWKGGRVMTEREVYGKNA